MKRSKRSGQRREEVIWNGVKFYRYPDDPNPSNSRYFTAVPARLHRVVWEHHNGPIPKGMHVHHIDGDTGNNDISNLEIVSINAHMKHHANEPERLEKAREHMKNIRHLSKAWHSTPEGKAHHSRIAKKQWVDKKPVDCACQHCGGSYSTIVPNLQAFCSNKCKSAARRASGVDDVDRACEGCGETFRINRYANKRYCSVPCRRRAQRARTGT